MKRVFGIGTVVVDHAVRLDRFPEPDTKNTVQRHWKQVGGPVPVALSTLAHFGGACRFLGRWGDDDPGRFVAATLRDRGIDTAASSSSPDWATGFAQVWTTPGGTRTIAYSRGEFPLPQPSDLPTKLDADILHLDGWAGETAIAAAQQMKERGGLVVLDAGSAKPNMDRLLPLIDILIASALFRQSWFGTTQPAREQLLSITPGSVITTHGPGGATWLEAGGDTNVSGISISAVDTNGAGDIFSGAILYGLASRWTAKATLLFANAVAAFSCQHFGNSTLPDLDEAKRIAGESQR